MPSQENAHHNTTLQGAKTLVNEQPPRKNDSLGLWWSPVRRLRGEIGIIPNVKLGGEGRNRTGTSPTTGAITLNC